MGTEKRRENPRYPVSFDALVDAEGFPLSAHVTDISANGLGAQSLKNIPPGTPVSIKAQIPDDVLFYGTLLWSQHAFVNNLDTYMMGFEIHAIHYKGKLHDETPAKDEAVGAIVEAIQSQPMS